MEVNLEELDRIIDSGMHAPLSEADGDKLKNALHALAKRVAPRLRSTEKSRDVIAGDNSAAEYTGAERIQIRHELLQACLLYTSSYLEIRLACEVPDVDRGFKCPLLFLARPSTMLVRISLLPKA